MGRSHAIATNGSIILTLNLDEQLATKNISMSITPNEQLSVESGLAVTVNPVAKYIVFQRDGTAVFQDAVLVPLAQTTLQIVFTNGESVSSNIYVFSNSGACQIVQPE